jgi:hypothetical protein
MAIDGAGLTFPAQPAAFVKYGLKRSRRTDEDAAA